jgi:peroxiredoxin
VLAVSEHLTQHPSRHPERETVDVVVVSFADDASRLAAYRDHLGVDVRLVADPDRELYGLFGAGRGSLRRVWSLGTLRLYATLLRRGRRLQRTTEDTRQLGADAVIDASGRVRRLWLPDGPDDRPPVADVIDAVDEALGAV